MTSWLDDGLSGARVLVTGAAGGIGAAVTAAFVQVGAQVLATDLAELPDSAAPVSLRSDLRTATGCTDLVTAARDTLGGLDVVAHMAGTLRRRSSLEEVTEEDWDAQHNINLRASFFLLRAAAGVMQSQGTGGRLIAATSQSWWTGGFGGSTVYAASKGGLVSLCRGMARTYGPHGITVNTVAPGAIDTPMLRTDLSEDSMRDILQATPLGRLGSPADIAAAVLFLASARAAFITAATVNISGGWLAY